VTGKSTCGVLSAPLAARLRGTAKTPGTAQIRTLWQDDDDVLWLMSQDIGDARVMLTDGQWTKDRTWTTYPANVQKIEEEQR